MKKIKKESLYIFFIVLLIVLLVGLFILTTTGLFYKGREGGENSFKVGTTAVISLEKTGCEVLSFEFDGSLLSGEFLKQNILVKNETSGDFFVRAKVVLFSEENDEGEIEIKTGESWTRFGNEYLFEGRLASLNTISFCSGFSLDKTFQLESTKTYILTICVEGLSAEFDRQEIWGY